jgi:hypothetical protein
MLTLNVTTTRFHTPPWSSQLNIDLLQPHLPSLPFNGAPFAIDTRWMTKGSLEALGYLEHHTI